MATADASSTPTPVSSRRASPSGPASPAWEHRPTSLLGNVVRGGLIGVVETIPGVSGGTVALVVGVYAQLIDSASHLISALRVLVLGPDRGARARAHFAQVHWRVILPLGAGMVAALLLVAGPMADLVAEHPVTMRGLFFGMVLASIAVPLRMALAAQRRRARALPNAPRTRAGRLQPRHVLAAVIAAIATFFLVSLPPTQVHPSPWVIVPAAAVAISALVLPGLSGSFLLLTLGLYEPTLRAVDELDLAYLGLFMVGALLGLAVVVKVLRWLLTHHEVMTLVVLTGLMTGGLRALWPWQSEHHGLLAPHGDIVTVMLLAVAGFVLVTALVVVDAWIVNRRRRTHATAAALDL